MKIQRLLIALLIAVLLAACSAEPDATPTPTATPTQAAGPPRNENVEALNSAQAELDDQDFGFAPLLRHDEAKVVLQAFNGAETARLTYPAQPTNPAAWSTVDSFVSAYAVQQFMNNLPQVGRVALGHLNAPASIDALAENVDHYAAWVTFLDGSRAVIDLTPLAANFASRHLPDRMILETTEIEAVFEDRRTGVNLDTLQPLLIVDGETQPYFLLAKIGVSFERYKFSLHIYPLQPADPITPLSIRPGASAEVEINRDELETLQDLLNNAGPTAFNEQPQLLMRQGSTDEVMIEILDEHLDLMWHLITKFEHQPPDPTIPTPTPTITPTPIPTPTPTVTPTPKKLPLVTS